MSISKEFEDAVKEGRLTLVRTMLKNSMVIDPTFEEFNEYSLYAQKIISGLYEEHDDEDDFITDSSLWDKSYMDRQFNNLMYNFSKKRIKHLKEVCKFIYADRIKNSEYKKSREHKEDINIEGKKVIGTTAVAGGLGMTLAGIMLEKAVLTTFGGTIAVIGAVMLFGSKDK